MPSWKIHEKYWRRLGIPPKIGRKVDGLIDSMGPAKARSLINDLIRKGKFPIQTIQDHLRLIKAWYEFGSHDAFRALLGYIQEEYGEYGVKVLFLHYLLDFIDRKFKEGYYSSEKIKTELKKEYETTSRQLNIYHKYLLQQIYLFVVRNFDEIIEDIEAEVKRKHPLFSKLPSKIEFYYHPEFVERELLKEIEEFKNELGHYVKVDLIDVSKLSGKELKNIYKDKATFASIRSKLKIADIFKRGQYFGKKVPALIVYDKAGNPILVYPHEKRSGWGIYSEIYTIIECLEELRRLIRDIIEKY